MTDPDGPDLLSLALLVAVAREGSISRAGAEFSMSQPSASARIRNLERRLGVELLDRRSGGAVPTDAGELVLGWAGDVLAAVDRLVLGAEALRTRRRQSLRVAASFTVAECLLPTWLASLHRAHRDAAVHLDVVNSDSVEHRVDQGHADLGFIESPGVQPGLASERVGTDELVLVVAPRHPWARSRRPVSAGELAAAPLVARERGSGTRAALEHALRRAGHETAVALVEMGSTAAILRAVEQEVGPAVISRLTVTRELAEGRLRAVPVDGVDLRRSLSAVWRRSSALGALAAVLLAIATEDGVTTTSSGPKGR